MQNNYLKRTGSKTAVAAILRKSWYHLRLSVRHPARVPTWDAIVLTASSPEQARLYEWQLNRAKRIGRISPSTVTLAVPDPLGCRIGSGAATLHAILALANHYRLEVEADHLNPESLSQCKWSGGDSHLFALVDLITKKHILLLHAGGDSKRVPWANPMGKVFIPLPYLATDDNDGPVPSLFDHILAIASCARQAFQTEGGILIMTGDVLPCFDASNLVLPEDASCIVTVPITVDIASNHGVIVASQSKISDEKFSVDLVENLLQKPCVEELIKHQAILEDGRTLLDTGIIAVRGKAWVDLSTLACSCEPMISELMESKKEMSLYEDLVAAWVPAKHDWLRLRVLGSELADRLGKHKVFSYCSYDLFFLHFGTSSEVLDHMTETCSGLVGRRHLCSIPATTASDIASSAIILSSKIEPGVSIGEDSLIYNSSISGAIRIGSQSIIVGLNVQMSGNRTSQEQFTFLLPDRHCLWEVPLVVNKERVIVYCGLHDNPKILLSKDGTFCGKPWRKILDDSGIQETDLWSSDEKCLWSAKLFPVIPYFDMLRLAKWIMGLENLKSEAAFCYSLWKRSRRLSLEELHRSIDFLHMCLELNIHQADIVTGIVKSCIDFGLLGRNLYQLCEEIVHKDEASGVEICEGFLKMCPKLHAEHSQLLLPRSRAYQVNVDLLRVCGKEKMAFELEHRVCAAVAEETAAAAKYGSEESENILGCILKDSNLSRKVKIELPVRVDFVGGWSDTPPWSLERAGCVLNMAITLGGSCLPIGTTIETSKETGVVIRDDIGNFLHINDLSTISPPFESGDPFRLVKCALLVTGIVKHKDLGLEIRTWSHVPRGSGLGTSSILAAAVVKAILQLSGGDESNKNVTRLVLVLEQIMGTGGGWQDQIGGLYPGIKFTTSFPGTPLRLQVIPLLTSPQVVQELQQRLLVVFTGQVRLAHQVLQKVVTRYLQRDNLLISSIKRLTELAKAGREELMSGNIDELGEIMAEAWRLHQELDPFCSNEYVDNLFAFCDPFCCGYKLVGAGGGGFALLLAKTRESADEMRRLLVLVSGFHVHIYNWEIFMQN
ncbi:unnamed protein product [Cuscuta europaea]|uniref:Bifunctional fucokinase/fucose pyrophosphorylase n=2 Tax=Cuscuta europaea TaxID=41803 RepID=A0A9P1EA99_CUSEU|nr:unnamed protein product [Cuscuta europaea]